MRYAMAICLLATALPSAFSQTRLKFEVASVKPSDPDSSRTSFDPGAKVGRFVATGASLKLLIGYAWDKQLTQISGGPKWLDSDRFDIEAKQGNIGTRPTDEAQRQEVYRQVRAMLQSLLEDRFHLVMDVIDRVPGLRSKAGHVRQLMEDERLRARLYTREHGEDAPDIRNWTWIY